MNDRSAIERSEDERAPHAEVIALDGPAGTGKSTVARLVAARLGLPYLDTGAMYRAVTFAVLKCGVDPSNGQEVADVARRSSVELDPEGGVTVNGLDATAAIRGPAVTAAVSLVAANPSVRSVLRDQQRRWVGELGSGVLEGRDIGTVVFPHARLKVYLDARPEVRAQRRASETGQPVDDVLAGIVERDRRDSQRQDSPMATAADAVVIETSELTVPEVVERVARAWAAAGGATPT